MSFRTIILNLLSYHNPHTKTNFKVCMCDTIYIKKSICYAFRTILHWNFVNIILCFIASNVSVQVHYFLEIISEFNPCFSRCAKWHPLNMIIFFTWFFLKIISSLLVQGMYPIIHAQFEWVNTFIPPYLIGYYLWLSMWVFVYKANFICLHENKSIIRFWIRLSKGGFHNITYFRNFDTCLSNI
jgi:hypothetical protein